MPVVTAVSQFSKVFFKHLLVIASDVVIKLFIDLTWSANC